MYKPVILPLAKKDIEEAAKWYNEQHVGLGKRFVKSVRSKVNRILINPQLYVIRYSIVHTALVDVFPFMIHFIIDENNKTLIFTAVLHTSQNPDLWIERKQ